MASSEIFILQKLENLTHRYEELGKLLANPKVLSNPQESQKYGKEQKEISPLMYHFNHYKEIQKQREEAEHLLTEPQLDPEFKEMTLTEIKRLNQEKEKVAEKIKILLVPQDPRDEKNVFLEIRAGTGGGKPPFSRTIFLGCIQNMPNSKSGNWRFSILI